MRTIYKDIILLTAFAMVGLFVYAMTDKPVEIQLHDTYFVLNALYLALLATVPLAFIIFLMLSIRRRFRSLSTLVLFILSMVLLTFMAYPWVVFN